MLLSSGISAYDVYEVDERLVVSILSEPWMTISYLLFNLIPCISITIIHGFCYQFRFVILKLSRIFRVKSIVSARILKSPIRYSDP